MFVSAVARYPTKLQCVIALGITLKQVTERISWDFFKDRIILFWEIYIWALYSLYSFCNTRLCYWTMHSPLASGLPSGTVPPPFAFPSFHFHCAPCWSMLFVSASPRLRYCRKNTHPNRSRNVCFINKSLSLSHASLHYSGKQPSLA